MKIIITITLMTALLLFIEFGISQKVAIIGKGYGGAFCSYFLHEVIPDIKIDVYDHQPIKKTTFTGTSFNSHYVYVNYLIQEKNILTVKKNDNGNCVIKEGNKCYSSDIKQYAGYKMFHIALKEYIMQQLQIFKQIYDFQKNDRTFKTVRELLKSLSLDFENYYVNETIENLINKNSVIAANPGIQKYIHDRLAIHFLDTTAHGFLGLACLMFSNIIEEQLASIDDNLFIKSLFHNDDETIEKDVSIIVRKNNKIYVLSIDGQPKSYDFVIFATTTAADLIQLKGFENPAQIFKYRDLHSSFFTGRLSNKITKIAKDLVPIYDRQINRVFMQIPLSKTHIYSIAGLQQILESDIKQYMKSYKLIGADTEIIHAPPDYSVKDESLRNAKFELGENLYNAHALHSLNVIDEFLAIGAKNIALLIKTRIEEIGTFADEQNPSEEKVNLSSIVEQETNKIIDDNTSKQRASYSTVGRKNRLGSGKSRAKKVSKRLN